jgi:BirA family biotin operon repressor/biotin-[acetyl-CoA-carboxylase] ligase
MALDLLELKPPGRWIGRRLDVHETVDSTNLIAEALAQDGAPEGTVVIADRQTAGRGRLGRSFFSPGGRSLYMSLILRPDLPAEQVHQHVFVAAAAVAETAAAALPGDVLIEIKWPNDVLLNGRKTSGINLPVQLIEERVASAVLGIGVNVNTLPEEFPPELRSIATSLRIARGQPLDRVSFAEELMLRLEGEIDAFRDQGFARVLDCWERFFRMHGDTVRVGGPGVARELQGTVEGVDEDGALLLGTPTGRQRILAGDVTVLRREDSNSAAGHRHR